MVTQHISPTGRFSQAGRELKVHAFDNSTSLEALVAAASAGIEAACSELHRRYNRVVCRITLRCLRLKGCNAVADHCEDIIASAWLEILVHMDQLKQSEKIESWMGTIVLNKVRGHVSGTKGCISDQRNRVPSEAVEQARIDPADKVCEDAILANEVRARAYAKSPKFGEVMRLYIEEEYTMDEIAKEFGESPAKLRSMYYRNLSDLRELFRDDNDDNDEPSES